MKLRNFDPLMGAARRARGLVAIAGLCGALLALPVTSRADIKLGGNLGPGDSYDTSFGLLVGNDFGGDNLAEGSSFVSSATAQVTALKIALSCFDTGFCPDDFTVALDADNSNQPGTALESFTVSAASLGALGNNNPVIVLSSILHPTLSAGTQYWVTVSSDLNDTIIWNWNSTGDTSAEAESIDGGSTWFSPSGNTPGAFEVSTPEVNSVLLLFTVVLFAGVLQLFRRKQAVAARHTGR